MPDESPKCADCGTYYKIKDGHWKPNCNCAQKLLDLLDGEDR